MEIWVCKQVIVQLIWYTCKHNWIIDGMLPLRKSLTCRCTDSGVDSVLRHLRALPAALPTAMSPDSAAAKRYPPKNQAKRNSIASSFLDCRCATGTRSAFHALSRTRSVALSQIVSFAVKNRWEESSSVRWRGESRDAGQRSGAEARGDVIHSGEHHHRETDLCLRQTKHCPRPHVHNQNFSNYTFRRINYLRK